MVKVRTQYRLNYQKDNSSWNQVTLKTKKQLIKAIRSIPLDWEIESCFCLQIFPSKQRGSIVGYNHQFEFAKRLKPLLAAKSIRKLWHHWNRLISGIIPAGFQVLTVGTDERIPTAFSLRNRIRSLVPNSYNCYLLDRDIRRYLKLELRHD